MQEDLKWCRQAQIGFRFGRVSSLALANQRKRYASSAGSLRCNAKKYVFEEGVFGTRQGSRSSVQWFGAVDNGLCSWLCFTWMRKS